MENTLNIMDIASTELTDEEIENLNALASNMPDDVLEQITGAKQHNFNIAKRKPLVRDHVKIGRNELCPCGSGKKYKNCCLASGEYETMHAF